MRTACSVDVFLNQSGPRSIQRVNLKPVQRSAILRLAPIMARGQTCPDGAIAIHRVLQTRISSLNCATALLLRLRREIVQADWDRLRGHARRAAQRLG